MTREETKRRLLNIERSLPNTFRTKEDVRNFEALEMAIKALEQEPNGDLISRDELLKAIDTWDKFGVDDTNSLFRLDNLSLPHYVPYIHYDDVVKCIKGMPSVNPQPCDDLISRQAVIDACEQSINILEAVDRIMDLPSVKQEPCSNCCNGNQIEKAKLCQKSYLAGMEHKQEPKTGHWIEDDMTYCGVDLTNYKCDKCGEIGGAWRKGLKPDKLPKYCMNCGCRMVEPQESDEQERVDDYRDRLDEIEREEYYESKYGKEQE